MTKLSIKSLNDKADHLCMICCNYARAIECLQKALILCVDLKRGIHYHPSFRSNSKEMIDLLYPSIFKTCHMSAPSRLIKYPSRKIEHDEGMYSHTRTLPMLPQIAREKEQEESMRLEELSISSIEAILCFNLAICYTLLDDEDKEADLYLDRTQDLISRCHNSGSVEFAGATNLESSTSDNSFLLDSITILHNKGLLYFRAKNFVKAIQSFTKAINQSIAKCSSDHLSVAVALNKIGVILSQDNDTDIGYALERFNKCLSIRVHVLGDRFTSDLDTATVFSNIGRTKFMQHDFEGALSSHMKAYNIRKAIIGEHHLDTSVALFHIGNCHHYLGQPDIALHHYSLFVKSILRSQNLELLNEGSLCAFEYIAQRLYEVGRTEHAKTFYELVFESAKNLSTVNDVTSRTVRILNRSGNVYLNSPQLKDNLAIALNFYELSLHLEMTTFPSGHINIASTMGNIAQILHYEGRLDEALQFYRKSVNTFLLSKTGMNEKCIEGVLSAQLNIGGIQEQLGNYTGALDTYSETLKIQRREYGNEDYRVSCLLIRIGKISITIGNIQGALCSFKESLKIRQNLDIPADSMIAAISNIAIAQFQYGNPEEALRCYKKIIEMEFSKNDDPYEEFDTISVLVILETMASIFHESFGKHDEALNCIKYALHLCMEEGLDVVSLDTLSRYLGMAGHLNLVLGDISSAILFFSEIMRINRKLGLEDFTNLKTAGYDFYVVSKSHRQCAPAA